MADVEICKATRRDVSWIAAHMREKDKAEIYCQLNHESPSMLAWSLLHMSPRLAFTASVDDMPVIAYGMTETDCRPGYGELWAFGIERHMYRAIKMVTDHINGELHEMLVNDPSMQRIECRSMAGHTLAHQWIEKIDLSPVCDLPCWGKNGEDFVLFARTRRELEERKKTCAEEKPRHLYQRQTRYCRKGQMRKSETDRQHLGVGAL